MKKNDIAWAAGLFEGEGSMIIRRVSRFPTVALQLQMRDRDAVEHFAEIVGVGSVVRVVRHTKNPKHSDMWLWQIANRLDCLRITNLLLPFFISERRKVRALEVIEAASTPDGRSKGITRRWQK